MQIKRAKGPFVKVICSLIFPKFEESTLWIRCLSWCSLHSLATTKRRGSIFIFIFLIISCQCSWVARKKGRETSLPLMALEVVWVYWSKLNFISPKESGGGREWKRQMGRSLDSRHLIRPLTHHRHSWRWGGCHLPTLTSVLWVSTFHFALASLVTSTIYRLYWIKHNLVKITSIEKWKK